MSSSIKFNKFRSFTTQNMTQRKVSPPEVSRVEHTYNSGQTYHPSRSSDDSDAKSYESKAYYEVQYIRQQQPDFNKTRPNNYRAWTDNAELQGGSSFVTPKRPFKTT